MTFGPHTAATSDCSPLRVLRLIARLNIGGPARHVVILDEGLRERGWRTLLVHGPPAPHEGSLEDLVASRRLDARLVPELGRRIHLLSDVRALFKLIRVTFESSPDVVHTHTAKAGFLGRVAAFVYNLPRRRSRRCLVVHTFHGHVLRGYFGRIGSSAARLAESILGLFTDRIVTISVRQRLDISRALMIVPRERFVIVPLGLELDDLLALQPGSSALRASLGWTDDVVVFGYVGRFAPIKDLPTLVRAFALAVSRNSRCRLLLAGDGEQRPQIEALVDELGLRDTVRLLEWQHDLAALYQAMDVAVISSLNEGTPVALIEAMAAGRPAVATAVGGVPDLVRDGETGMLVRPGDPEALAAALCGLATNSPARARMGTAARADVAQRFRSERLIEDIARLYETGLREKRGLQAHGAS